MNKQEWIKGLKEQSAYMLAELADCGTPNRQDSPGAVLLYDARAEAIEALESGDWDGFPDGDWIFQQARTGNKGGVVTFQTRELWETFVDLAAYREDVSVFTFTLGGSYATEDYPTVALGQIVERLLFTLKRDYESHVDESDE